MFTFNLPKSPINTANPTNIRIIRYLDKTIFLLSIPIPTIYLSAFDFISTSNKPFTRAIGININNPDDNIRRPSLYSYPAINTINIAINKKYFFIEIKSLYIKAFIVGLLYHIYHDVFDTRIF